MPSVDGRESARSGGNIRAEQDPRMVFSQNDSEEAVLSQVDPLPSSPSLPAPLSDRSLCCPVTPFCSPHAENVGSWSTEESQVTLAFVLPLSHCLAAAQATEPCPLLRVLTART
eukprot:748048-Hanusia_phi.AAC.1